MCRPCRTAVGDHGTRAALACSAAGSAFSPSALRSRRRLCVLAAGSAFSPPALRSRRRLCGLAAGSAFSPPALRSRRRLCGLAAGSACSPPALRSRRRLCVLAAGSAVSLAGSAARSPALRLARRLCGSSPALRLLAGSAAPRRLCGSSPALRLLAGSAAPRRLCGSSPALRLLAGSAAPRRLCGSSPALRAPRRLCAPRRSALAACLLACRPFACAIVASLAPGPAAGARPPRRAALALLPLVLRTRTRPSLALAGRFPAALFFLLASRCAARHAASFRNFAAPARTDDRRTNDATCGPQEWLTGSLHEGGIRSVRSPLRRAPLLATPIATPLQCGRPKRPDLLFNFSHPQSAF